MYRNVYLPKGSELTPVTRAMAAWLWAGRDANTAGLSASRTARLEMDRPRCPPS